MSLKDRPLLSVNLTTKNEKKLILQIDLIKKIRIIFRRLVDVSFDLKIFFAQIIIIFFENTWAQCYKTFYVHNL
jgi:hypothetical protein